MSYSGGDCLNLILKIILTSPRAPRARPAPGKRYSLRFTVELFRRIGVFSCDPFLCMMTQSKIIPRLFIIFIIRYIYPEIIHDQKVVII